MPKSEASSCSAAGGLVVSGSRGSSAGLAVVVLERTGCVALGCAGDGHEPLHPRTLARILHLLAEPLDERYRRGSGGSGSGREEDGSGSDGGLEEAATGRHAFERTRLWAAAREALDCGQIMLGTRHEYVEGQAVRFTIPDACEGSGRIRGRASTGLVDVWIVEPDASAVWKPGARARYPFSCVAVTHPAIRPFDRGS